MKTIARVLAVVVSVAAATTAVAGDRLSEASYLKAARCQGLAHGLGPVDTTAIDTVVRTQGEGRDVRLRNEARTARLEAQEAAAKSANKSRLTNELNTKCVAWVNTQSLANSGAVSAR